MISGRTVSCLCAIGWMSTACTRAPAAETGEPEDTCAGVDTFDRTPDPRWPQLADVTIQFGWDDAAGEVRPVQQEGKAFPQAVMVSMRSQYAGRMPSPPLEEICAVNIDVALTDDAEPPGGDHRLALKAAPLRVAMGDCAGWDLSHFGEDPFSWFGALEWRIEAGGELPPDVIAAEWLRGATFEAPGFVEPAADAVFYGLAVDEDFEIVREEVQPGVYDYVALTGEEMLQSTKLASALYVTRSVRPFELDTQPPDPSGGKCR